MKKLIVPPLCAALLITTASLGASYAREAEVEKATPTAIRISPALDVLAGELTLTKTGLVAHEIVFSPVDFESALGVGYLPSITVLTLPDPEVGTLYLDAMPVMKNQVISRASISSLRFVPATEGEADCSFVFGTVSTSQPLALSCILRLSSGLNFAPDAANNRVASLVTMASIPVWGNLTATDPEGDALTYRIVSYPENGTIRMTDRGEGQFCYTPLDGFVGKDSFTYVAMDAWGNTSAKMTVEMVVEENTTNVTYCDMKGHKALLPAMRLAEAGVMIGETIGASAYFHPTNTVTRAEFLAMAMCAAGMDVPESKEKTTFADDDQIPAHLRKYVSYAAKKGYISGNLADQTGNFEPGRGITYAEAAVILKNVLNLTPSGAYSVFAEEDSVPAWAEPAVWAVAEAGLFPDNVFAADSILTRADTAVMLAKVLER